MTGPTDPSEEYFDKGLWGWATNTWEKLISDGSGLLKVILGGQDADLDVKQTTPSDLAVGVHGYDGSAWQSLSLLWGYTDRYVEQIVENDATAGTNTLLSTAVPAGYVYVINACEAVNTNKAVLVEISAYDGTYYTRFVKYTQTAAADPALSGFVSVPLKEGDKIRAVFYACDLNDNLRLRVWGSKMAVA